MQNPGTKHRVRTGICFAMHQKIKRLQLNKRS
ncbi:hypothetical protein EDD73_14220 [Heliophilum fasciatum]|uniref:Uncharacterized protein n=1 Tax=Heliophilum fasciatum TaxID=35700 RepID=A0A4R2RCH2_9FIRM|nr:hypothetical protein [Heliophilum fasciatum]TCP60104.1 hypothetical protein EDD73_14220 [Heliophilum fasciatum]